MATHSFLSLYQLDGAGVVVGSATSIVAESVDATLSPGDEVTMERSGSSFVFEFKHASGDGFVATLVSGSNSFPLGDYWFSDTAYGNGTVAPDDGDSYVLCFLEGTLIATPAGERPVESLAIGDAVLDAEGRALPVRWLGQRTVASRFADRAGSFPIRIGAGALGEALPRRDLYLSPAHALLLDGVLVQAGALVNGSSIRQLARPPERFTYFHIELAGHALVLAEGAAAETFVDNAARSRFDNHADYVALYGEAAAATGELAAPRVRSPRQLPAALRDRLAARAAMLDAA
ncbi:Hint domain-containing protein [Roseomonas sp. 18066]|uniref:Hint domain-containing protein n=1 Tax=Roseomonas sp. 18066 TaxID=2681412 RepID=UPI00135C1D66|nr:Hint domain-containing protein [Roseomonas sp. 18066]